MCYQMIVTISNPDTPKGMFSALNLNLEWKFSKNDKTYGNKYYVRVQGEGFEPMGFDLRYDKSFDKNHPEKWIEAWARNYWNGKDGAWQVAKLEIEKI
jgi:hypothetical protein